MFLSIQGNITCITCYINNSIGCIEILFYTGLGDHILPNVVGKKRQIGQKLFNVRTYYKYIYIYIYIIFYAMDRYIVGCVNG